MFDFNRRYAFFRRVVVVIFVVPLMFTGGALLGDLAQQQTVGEVESLDIPRSEYVSRYQSLSERYRRETGEETISPAVARQINQRIQNDLLSSYLVFASLDKKGVHAPDDTVAEEIRNNTEFHDESGNFSLEEYQDLVIDQRYYQEQIRRSVGQQPIFRMVNGVPIGDLRQELIALRRQQRIVDEVQLPLDVLTTTTLAISDEEVDLYYQQNAIDYFLREEAAFEYFVLSTEDFIDEVTVSVGAAREAYEVYIEDWNAQQRWHVRHSYVADEQVADELYGLVSAAPDSFEALAQERSEDFGSAAAGGDLGIVAIGDLPEAFDDVIATMKVGQIHPPVQTTDGFSIIKLDEIIDESVPEFSAVAEEMEQHARREAAREALELAAEELSLLAPIEIGSLDTMAATVGVSVAMVATVYRNFPTENPAPFADDIVLSEAFAAPVISAGENSEPILLGEDSYIFLRAARYQPAGRRPLIEVEESIITKLRTQQVVTRLYETLSEDTGATTLTVKAYLEGLDWDKTHTVILASEEEIDEDELDSSIEEAPAVATRSDLPLDLIYIADLSKGLPAYVFEPLENTVRAFRIREIEEGEPQEEDQLFVDDLLNQMTAQLGYLGYLDELGGQYKFQFYNLPEVEEQPQGPTF